MATTTSLPMLGASANLSMASDVTALLLDSTANLTGSGARTHDNMTSLQDEDGALAVNSSMFGGNETLACIFSATLNGTLCVDTNGSTINGTTGSSFGTMPHSVWVIVILGLLAGIVSLVTILGNITVLLAFGLERTIRQPTNYFLASLAVSDLLIGTFSMPLYTQYLLWGKWPLGPWLCDLWLSLDWTVCLTSQYTVFLITMDRFLSVKIPAKYRSWRTERKVLVMIAVTWILPAIVFFTSIIGWQYFVGKRTVAADVCEVQFMGDTMFTFLLTIGYYWITLFVMCSLYGGIYKVALDLQRKSDAKHKKMQSTMELAGDNPQNAIRSFGEGGSNNNSSVGGGGGGSGGGSGGSGGGGGSGGSSSQSAPVTRNNSKAKLSKSNSSRKSVKAALPCPVGPVNTTSFTSSKSEKDDDRSSSPAFASDDDNSSSGGATGTCKSPLTSGVYTGGKSLPAIGVVNSALFANTGGLVRSLHGDLFFSQAAAAGGGGGGGGGGGDGHADSSPSQVQSPPPYSTLDPRIIKAGDAMSTGVGNSSPDGQLPGMGGGYTSASDPLEKQTTPLLLQTGEMSEEIDINRGCRFIDEKSLLATLSESAALLPALTGESELEDSDFADLHASSPIWKRRSSLPPLATDVFDLDDEAMSENMLTENATQTTALFASTGSASAYFPDHTTASPGAPLTADGAVATGTVLPQAGGRVGKNMIGNNCSSNNNNNYPEPPPSETNTNEDSSRSDTHCLSAVRVRRNKDTRLHSFVKSVRSRNSRRRIRRERKSKSENRARKALRTISFILGAFVLCWTPYHVNIMVIALCKNCVNPFFYSFSYWLCYLNSPLNPFCYAFSNAQFKRTFLRIMRFDWHRT